MVWQFLTASVLMVLILLTHLIAGGIGQVRPLLRSGVDPVTKYTHYYCWHVTSITLLSLAVCFGISGLRKDLTTPGVIASGLTGLFAVWGFVLPLLHRQSFKDLPQGLLFAPVAGLGAWGISVALPASY